MVFILIRLSTNIHYQPFRGILVRRIPDQPSPRRACFLSSLALGLGVLALYLVIDVNLAKLRPGETVAGGIFEPKPLIMDLLTSIGTGSRIAEPPARLDSKTSQSTSRHKPTMFKRIAQVRGRVLLAETGEPLNKDTVRNLLERTGKWAKLRANNHGYDPSINPQIVMTNWRVEENRLWYETPSYPESYRLAIDPDGRFEFTGLLPHDSWVCKTQLNVLPNFIRTNITLKPGMNDLGDLRVGVAGELSGKITDEKGEAVKKAYVQFPTEGSSPCEQTNEAGEFHFDLTPMTHDRQIVRISPLWGIDPEDGLYDSYEEHLVYEAILPLERTTSHTLTTRLDRGNTLLVEIPPSPLRDQLVHAYEDQRNMPFEEVSLRKYDKLKPFFAVSGAILQALAANPEGFVYHRFRQVHQGLQFTTGTMVLRIDHVPPGRHALRLDGGFFVTRPAISGQPARFAREEGLIMRLPETPPQPPETNMVSYDTSFPLAYTEFEMLDTTTTLRLELSPTTIEMELEGLPQKYRTGYEISTLVFFERKQPQSTVYGDSLRKLLMKEAAKLNDGDDLESRLMPMMGYYTFFSVQDPTTKVSHYCPRQIPAVPPGLYRLQAYNGVKEFQKITPAKPYYETEIQVTGTEGKINVSIPF